MEKIIIGLTQEQINTIVHDSCVLFCKHCGCGIPRDTCTSLGTCKEHDEYRTAIRTHLMEKKKKEYPTTIEECCKILGLEFNPFYTGVKRQVNYKDGLLHNLKGLLIYRDAYWKIAGEEMGLGKPWEPSDSDYITGRYCIFVHRGNIICDTPAQDCILTFPTPEMRDAFKKNFDQDIEICKKLL